MFNFAEGNDNNNKEEPKISRVSTLKMTLTVKAPKEYKNNVDGFYIIYFVITS